ncbi:MAG TPA: LapA family protein [Chloroflexota bacterium]|nr:LapA family protein [Chloroflexota bacterium]
MIPSLVSGLLVAILVAIFAFQNGGPVVVRFFRAELHVSLGLALTLSAAAGMIAGLLLAAAALVRKSMVIATLRRHNDVRSPPSSR